MLTDFIERRQRVFVERDAQVVVSYLVIRAAFAIMVNAEHQDAVERANNHALYPRRRLDLGRLPA